MPVTKTAKRALRGSKRKNQVNKTLIAQLEVAIRIAQKSKKDADIKKAVSLTDRAKKKKVFHKNKAARIKSALDKLTVSKPSSGKTKASPVKKNKTSKK